MSKTHAGTEGHIQRIHVGPETRSFVPYFFTLTSLMLSFYNNAGLFVLFVELATTIRPAISAPL